MSYYREELLEEMKNPEVHVLAESPEVQSKSKLTKACKQHDRVETYAFSIWTIDDVD